MLSFPDYIINLMNPKNVLVPPGRLYLKYCIIQNVGIYVEKVYPGSPLLNTIRAGDVILGVDGISTSQYSKDFVQMIFVLKERSERNLMDVPTAIVAPFIQKMVGYEAMCLPKKRIKEKVEKSEIECSHGGRAMNLSKKILEEGIKDKQKCAHTVPYSTIKMADWLNKRLSLTDSEVGKIIRTQPTAYSPEIDSRG